VEPVRVWTLVAVASAIGCSSQSPVTNATGSSGSVGSVSSVSAASSTSGATASAASSTGTSTGTAAGTTSGGASTSGFSTGSSRASDGGPLLPVPDGGTYRNSLSVCWTDADCPRAMAIGHGGMWDAVNNPYLSNGAIALAYDGGMDGVKIDVRVSSDNVPVLAHSSPIQIYESLNCYNEYIEDMTADEIVQCDRVPTTQTFQRLDDVLSYIQGKMVVQLTVKRTQDYATVIGNVSDAGANDYAFFEVLLSDLQNELPTIPGWNDFYYMVDLSEVPEDAGIPDISTVLAFHNPWIFMVEFGPPTMLGSVVTSTLHPAGVRSFIYDDGTIVTEQTQVGYFDGGYDVVSTNSGANGVAARIVINTMRGISPP
jgi:Glycerophosphoryl diester phosphodiesterase family